VSSWRVQAAIIECGLTLEEEWSGAQRQIFIKLAEGACKKLAPRESILADEIVSPEEALSAETTPGSWVGCSGNSHERRPSEGNFDL
jgi:hypothetical protein